MRSRKAMALAWRCSRPALAEFVCPERYVLLELRIDHRHAGPRFGISVNGGFSGGVALYITRMLLTGYIYPGNNSPYASGDFHESSV